MCSRALHASSRPNAHFELNQKGTNVIKKTNYTSSWRSLVGDILGAVVIRVLVLVLLIELVLVVVLVVVVWNVLESSDIVLMLRNLSGSAGMCWDLLATFCSCSNLNALPVLCQAGSKF